MESKVRAELLKLSAKHGDKLTPEQVVAAAKPVTSPLHSSFTWNDSTAAHQYRLWQARQLLRVVVQYIPQSKEPVNVFVSLRSDRQTGQGYRPLVTVLTDEEKRQELLEDACAEMNIFRRKYRGLKELADVFEAMDKALAA